MKEVTTELAVLGGGPAGYTAAFDAADRGMSVVLVEEDGRLGGVCLTRGCIPSKAFLSASALISRAQASGERGITFAPPSVDIGALRAWKGGIVETLARSLSDLCRKRGITVLWGRGHFEGSDLLRVETKEGQIFLRYDKAVIAVGSAPAVPTEFDLGNPRVMTSREALDLKNVPNTLLVVGGGYIGMELGVLYARLGSRVVLAEAAGTILTGTDGDLVRPVLRRAERIFSEIRLGTKVVGTATSGKHITVTTEAKGKKKEEQFDAVLVAVGRAPNCRDLGLENTRLSLDGRGFIIAAPNGETSDPSLLAVGDVTGGTLLAHCAMKQARVAVEAVAGGAGTMTGVAIPSVVYTDPEVAWAGMTEAEAGEKGIPVRAARFPWAASGRALTLGCEDGLTKLIIEPETERIIGVGIVGEGAEDLIGEGVLALEMAATARDVADSVHPHPTLSETFRGAAEAYLGVATDIFMGKRMGRRGSGSPGG